jgi:hypothetical protein
MSDRRGRARASDGNTPLLFDPSAINATLYDDKLTNLFATLRRSFASSARPSHRAQSIRSVKRFRFKSYAGPTWPNHGVPARQFVPVSR